MTSFKVVIFVSFLSEAVLSDKSELVLGGFFLLDNYTIAENLCLEAAKIAVRDVNNYPQLLPDYKLSLAWVNSECSESLATSTLLKMLAPKLLPVKNQYGDNDINDSEKPAIAVMGPLCGTECEVMAPIVKIWDSVQVSYGCGSAPKAKRFSSIDQPYSNLFRLEPGLPQYNEARLAFLRHFNWTKAMVLYHVGRGSLGYFEDQQSLIKFLTSENVSIPLGEMWLEGARESFVRMIKEDVRVVFFAFSQDETVKALVAGCDAFKMGIKGPKYVWIGIAHLSAYWWRTALGNETVAGCGVKELDEVWEGMFYVGEKVQAPPEQLAATGRRLSDVEYEVTKIAQAKFRAFIHRDHLQYLPVCYDNVVILSLALNQTEADLVSLNSSIRLGNFDENRHLVANLISKNLRQMNYLGYKGHYRFDSATNDPVFEHIFIHRDFNNTRKSVFQYNQINRTAILYDLIWLTWNGKAPLDEARHINQPNNASTILRAVVSAIACLSAALTLLYALILFYKLKSEEVRRMSPKFVLIMLSGCIFIYLHLCLTVTASRDRLPTICKCRYFLLIVGCCLLFGGLFIKVFRVFLIFTRLKHQFLLLKDNKLVAIVFLWTALNIVLLLIWFHVGEFHAKVEVIEKHYPQQDLIVKLVSLKCCSLYANEMLYLFGGLQATVLFFGSFVSFFTRNVTVGQVHNDSKQIALCIYITILSTVLAIVVSYAIEDVNLSYGLLAAVVLSATICIQSVILRSSLQGSIVSFLIFCRGKPAVSPTFLVKSNSPVGNDIMAAVTVKRDRNGRHTRAREPRLPNHRHAHLARHLSNPFT